MSISANDLRERFERIFTVKVDDDDCGWPPETGEEMRLRELIGVVGDILIWIEDQEKEKSL